MTNYTDVPKLEHVPDPKLNLMRPKPETLAFLHGSTPTLGESRPLSNPCSRLGGPMVAFKQVAVFLEH